MSSGAVELLKWLALAAMVIDHVNAAFFGRELGLIVTATGRVAMPLFALVLGYNLARPGADLRRCFNRLVLFGLLATPAHALLFAQLGGWWPLNILWTFAVAVGVMRLLLSGHQLAALAVFVVVGSLVEYWWPGVALVITAWAFFRSPTAERSTGLFAALLFLCLVNLNAWALLSIPVVILAAWAAPVVPRLRWVFWWFYPAHLVVLALAVMATA